MKRFSKIPSRFRGNDSMEFIDYEQKKDFDEFYIVDTSGYVPNQQAVQVLNRQFAVSMMDKLTYDMPDEIKYDAVNLFARRKNIDIAELSKHQESLKSEIEKRIEDAKARYVRRHQREVPKKTTPPAPDKD